MLDAELIDILACPETKQPVHLIDQALIGRVNAAIAAGSLKNRDGEAVTEVIQTALLREDGEYLYPVRDDIPVMLIGEGIRMADVPS